MTAKRLRFMMLIALSVFVQSAFAQKVPAPGTNITVSKSGGGMFTTVQAAVNAALPGQIIEILDEAVYEEQVTIDGRENRTANSEDKFWTTVHPWGAGVVGGKHGITIRYVPAPGVTGRPAIRWLDTLNRSPLDQDEAQILGDGPGTVGNWQTCAALRILSTSGITIEGIIVDGVRSAPFGAAAIYSGGSGDLFHGNAAVVVVNSGNVQIRDCQLRNAYFGIYIKDRNTGGVFGNPNPDDHDYVIPLSDFGKTGNHLIEYNKINDNAVGLFFESSWDLGSTVRYNLIYNNFHKAAVPASIPGSTVAKTACAIMFKDNYLSPAAIYNNTFFNNNLNFIGPWQVGFQHLVFNNIFGRTIFNNTTGYDMDGFFPHRMKHSVFAARIQGITDFTNSWAPVCPGYEEYQKFANNVQSMLLGGVARTNMSIQVCPNFGGSQNQSIDIVLPGARFSGGSSHNTTIIIPPDANIRWLEMAGGTFFDGGGSVTLPNLFKSTNPADTNFLVPDWDHQQVKDFIRNAGWPASGIINEDGTIADLGAIPFSGKRPVDSRTQTSRARIKPFDIVKIDGTTASASIYITQEIGSLNNLTIKYLRWIAPLPDGTGNHPTPGYIIPAESIHEINTAGITLNLGSNYVNFTLPEELADIVEYGFFEMVAEGTNAIGQRVTTDVGFLPFRNLDKNRFDIVIVDGATIENGIPVVIAGEPVTISIIANSTASLDGSTLDVGYRLLSDPTARMWRSITPQPDNSLERELWDDGVITKTYTVYFTKAGDEVISVAGAWSCSSEEENVCVLRSSYWERECVSRDEWGACISWQNRFVQGDCIRWSVERRAFLGALRLKVLPEPITPEAPAQVVFLSPPSISQLSTGASLPVLNGWYSVEVQVRDRFDNPINTEVDVSLESSNTDLGYIMSAPTVQTDPSTGTAHFIVVSDANAQGGAEFELRASINLGAAPAAPLGHNRNAAAASAPINFSGDLYASDTARLRIQEGANIVTSPRVVGGAYRAAGGSIYATELTFDQIVTANWFTSMGFIFSPSVVRGTVTNTGCIFPGGDAHSVMVVMGCGFPGTNFTEEMGTGSMLTINYSALRGWAPQTMAMPFGMVSVLENDRVVPDRPPVVKDSLVDQSAVLLNAEFTAGPNPVSKQFGAVNFFVGAPLAGARNTPSIRGALTIYDASGNVVNKIRINDDINRRDAMHCVSTMTAGSAEPRRIIGSWDLTDRRGRPVSDGTYLVRGVITTSDGKRERVSVMVGVR
ncbi:MAG: hypothetical protein FWE57_11265 [Chitinispirillia bacterium]|nr:hypothetical protein [Chitinispirillia bacterium]